MLLRQVGFLAAILVVIFQSIAVVLLRPSTRLTCEVAPLRFPKFRVQDSVLFVPTGREYVRGVLVVVVVVVFTVR